MLFQDFTRMPSSEKKSFLDGISLLKSPQLILDIPHHLSPWFDAANWNLECSECVQIFWHWLGPAVTRENNRHNVRNSFTLRPTARCRAWYRWLSTARTSSRGKTDGCEVSSSSLMAGGASDRKMPMVHTPACRQKTWGSHQSCPAGGRAGQCPSSLREALCIRSLRSVTTLLLFSVLGLNRATTRVTRGRHGRQHWIQKMKSKISVNDC